MEELEEVWERLKLNEEENVPISINVGEEFLSKAKRSLVGKIIVDRTIGKEVVRRTMEKIWSVGKPLVFHEFRANCFIIMFINSADRNRVLRGKPWLFDNHLFVLKLFDGFTQPNKINFEEEEFWIQLHNLPLACMSKSVGELIGRSVGEVVDVDVMEDGLGWGRFMRVRVVCDLRKAVARGRTVNLLGRNMWVPLTYEKLPRICFKCGRILHSEEGCLAVSGEEGGQFRPWLRAGLSKNFKSVGWWKKGTESDDSGY
ncbi:hypothetical protein F2P56_034811 [Juglans regia]|uniref:Uncharacterized protein LOC109000700 n=2 Tax=Juglans regia TaxID=51240 RepID=A0A2I4FNK9_JUGRE|nr:uncharacterized protein LOC109000700 [Juglans regia]KAF5445787.1 hypothetical protein F2P56_034811 [Juglans regia]